MWWLLAIWLLARGKQPPAVSGPNDSYLRNQLARTIRNRSGGSGGHDHRNAGSGGGGRPSRRTNVDVTDSQPHQSNRHGFDPSKNLEPSDDMHEMQPSDKGYNPYVNPGYNPYNAQQYNPYNAPYGQPETQPQSWQGDGGQGYGDAYADAYEGFSEGQGEGDDMVATPGHWRRARANEQPDTPDGMVWEDD